MDTTCALQQHETERQSIICRTCPIKKMFDEKCRVQHSENVQDASDPRGPVPLQRPITLQIKKCWVWGHRWVPLCPNMVNSKLRFIWSFPNSISISHVSSCFSWDSANSNFFPLVLVLVVVVLVVVDSTETPQPKSMNVGAALRWLSTLVSVAKCWCLSSVADPGGPGHSLPPRFFFKSCSFQALLGENPYFEQMLGSGPLLGSKLHWAPILTKILDPRLIFVLDANTSDTQS